jgi:hypothetical protein
MPGIIVKKWAKYQPKDGDLILVCGHSKRRRYHWYALDLDDSGSPQPLQFKRPDGTEGESAWACICDSCDSLNHGNPKASIRGERIWIGNEPFISDYTQ